MKITGPAGDVGGHCFDVFICDARSNIEECKVRSGLCKMSVSSLLLVESMCEEWPPGPL